MKDADNLFAAFPVRAPFAAIILRRARADLWAKK